MMMTTLMRWLANYRLAAERRSAAAKLDRLTEAQLLDVGLERGDIAAYVAQALPYEEPPPHGAGFTPQLHGCG